MDWWKELPNEEILGPSGLISCV